MHVWYIGVSNGTVPWPHYISHILMRCRSLGIRYRLVSRYQEKFENKRPYLRKPKLLLLEERPPTRTLRKQIRIGRFSLNLPTSTISAVALLAGIRASQSLFSCFNTLPASLFVLCPYPIRLLTYAPTTAGQDF